MTRSRRALIGLAMTLAALSIVEMAMRDMARRSVCHLAFGATPPPWLLVALACGPLVFVRKSWTLLVPVFVAGIGVQMALGARLQSDGFYYYAYLRSLAFDGDVNFTNDYRLLGLGDKAHLFTPTPTGYAQSAWTIGPAIVWSPFFAVGHLVAARLHASGAQVSVDGTSFPYRQSVCIAGLFYGLLGCWFAYRVTRRFWQPSLAAAAVVLTVAGSFMPWYMLAEPSMTHAPSMAAVAGFVWLWLATRERRTPGMWGLLGVLAGVMALIRWQNALFMVLPGFDAVRSLAKPDEPRERIDALAGGTLFLACAAIAFTPQMIAWKAIYGSYVARSPVGPEIRWAHPHLSDILFSARNGLLSTSPILYLSAIGLILLAIERPDVGAPALAAAAIMVYFNACIQDWWGSAGFGGRRFDGIIPLFCLGLAAFADATARVVRRHALAAVTAALAAAALWNIALMQVSHEGVLHIGETIPFDRAWAAQARAVHGWFGNPFSYPANLVFALRNGVGPGDYDLLSTNRLLGDPLQPYARIDIGGGDDWLIEDGWHAPEREGAITFRWAADRASMRLPLDHAAPLRVVVRLHAFAFPGAPAQTLTLAANGRTCAPARPSANTTAMPVGSDWQTVECTLDESAWRAGVNHVSFVFAYAARPVDVGIGGDTRPLSAAVDWVRVSITSPDTAR
jgi:Dolichyl-phosphate-mannose-protein mannosyltransferase